MSDTPDNAIDGNQVLHFLQKTAVSLVNMQRMGDETRMDYVQFTLPQSMPQIPEERNIIQQQIQGKPPLSLLGFERALDRIANDSRPRGVILNLRGMSMPFADLKSLRDIILRFRQRGKRVVCYSQDYNLPDYYVATAADEILLQPGGTLMTVGLMQQQVYLKDGLNAIGLEADSVQISPYKSAADQLTRSEPSAENKAMTEWLLDSLYETLIEGIAEGRGITEEAAHEFIDTSPYIDRNALEDGVIDGLVREEELEGHLDVEHIVLWEKADAVLPLRRPKPPGDYVAVLRVAGNIIQGESGQPPADIPIPLIGGERMGDLTVVRQVRNLMKDDSAKALVLYINSGGGSASASEAMASALNELAKTRPVVVYMGAVAASGGYYIATPADYIVAQPGTITGSIGVIAAKLINNEALRKLRFNPVTYKRGANAGIFSGQEPFNETERAKVQESIERIYEQFVQRVADARKMKPESVDEVGGGRVWTGKQALENGLVDELGGLHEAIMKARELAGLPADAAMRIIRKPGKPLPAQLADQVDPAATMRYWQENLAHMTNGSAQMLMPFDFDWTK
jgi:protease-4